MAINYHTALVSARPADQSAPNDQQIYLRALRTIHNLSTTYWHFLTHSVQMTLAGVTPTKRVWVDKTEEKGSDVTEWAQQRNVEAGVLIRNPKFARQLRQQFEGLVQSKQVRRSGF